MRTHRLTRACRRVPGRDPGTCTGRHLWHRERLHPPNRQAYRCHFDPIPHIELPGRRRTECHTEARNDPMGRCRSCRPHTGPEEPPDDTRRHQGRTHAGAGAPPTSPRGSPARPGRQTAADEAATPLPAGLTTSAPSGPRRRATTRTASRRSRVTKAPSAPRRGRRDRASNGGDTAVRLRRSHDGGRARQPLHVVADAAGAISDLPTACRGLGDGTVGPLHEPEFTVSYESTTHTRLTQGPIGWLPTTGGTTNR